MSVNYKLFEKNLTYKLTVLFALSSALRASSIQHLSIKFMAKAKSYYRFSFKNGWRKGKAPLPVAFQEYAQDETLSVDYGGIYSQTERWRSGEEHSQFLLSFLHPYKPVISSRTSGWLKLSSWNQVFILVPLRLIQPDLYQPLKQIYMVHQYSAFLNEDPDLIRVPGKDFVIRILLKRSKYSRKWYLSQHEIYKTLWTEDGGLGSILGWASQAWET